MLEKIENILKQLGIDVSYQQYLGKSKEYLIFDIYDEKDSEFCDDANLSTTYGITINYWHSTVEKYKNYKVIKELMKANGFFFDGMKSLNRENGLYGKNFTFKYEEIEEEY